MCEVASFDYKDYNSHEQLYYWDEAGMVIHYGGWGDYDYSGWMASAFTSSQDGNLTHVDFWTTSNNAQYAIYVYLDDDPTDGLDSLATSQSGTCAEFGYYSIPLDSPVPLTTGQPFTIAVEVTTPGYTYPIPVELQDVGQTDVCFIRHLDTDAWEDAALTYHQLNVCLRARVMSEAAGEPDITVDPTSFNVTLPPDTTHDYVMQIGNTGDATLTYTISDSETTGGSSTISDSETTGGSSTARSEDSLSGPGSMVLKIPLERRPAELENAGEAQAGWQNIMTDGFEGAFPGVWDVLISPGSTNAYWGKDNYNPHTGSYSAFCAKSGPAGVDPPNNYPNNMEAWMIYGPFSLTDVTDAELNFYYWLDSEYEWDYLWCEASIDETNWYGHWYTGDFGGWVSES